MLLVKNGRVLDPQTGLDKTCDILIDGKRIARVDLNCSVLSKFVFTNFYLDFL